MNLSHKVENPSNSLAKWMEHSEKEKYLTLLQESLAEVEGYLKSSEDAAAAVAPDKGLGRLSRMEAMQDQQLVMEMRRRKKGSWPKSSLHYPSLIWAIMEFVFSVGEKFQVKDWR